MEFDLAITDALLATTRSVRKRLDLDRPVPREVILECLELAVQAPTGSNSQGWRWVVVEDAAKRAAIAELYRTSFKAYNALRPGEEGRSAQTERVIDSANWLADNMAKVPVFLIPCIEGRVDSETPLARITSVFGSIFPAVWSFQLALRARGLGSTLTTLHLIHEKTVAELLGLPDDVMQVALLPVAYTKGTDFKRAQRPPVANIIHWNGW
jgi:nitroreductase